jgi:hypothetical protein
MFNPFFYWSYYSSLSYILPDINLLTSSIVTFFEFYYFIFKLLELTISFLIPKLLLFLIKDSFFYCGLEMIADPLLSKVVFFLKGDTEVPISYYSLLFY